MKQKKGSGFYSGKKIRQSISALCLAFVLFSCSEKPVTIPSDVVGKDTMTLLLTEMHLAQAVVNVRPSSDTSAFTTNDYIAFILKNRGISTEKFFRSTKFYSHHPELLREMYDSVITSISRMEGEVEGSPK